MVKYYKSENECLFYKVEARKVIQVTTYNFRKAIIQFKKGMYTVCDDLEITEEEFRSAYSKILKTLIL